MDQQWIVIVLRISLFLVSLRLPIHSSKIRQGPIAEYFQMWIERKYVHSVEHSSYWEHSRANRTQKTFQNTLYWAMFPRYWSCSERVHCSLNQFILSILAYYNRRVGTREELVVGIGNTLKSTFYMRGTTSEGWLRALRNAHNAARTIPITAEIPPRARRKKRKEGWEGEEEGGEGEEEGGASQHSTSSISCTVQRSCSEFRYDRWSDH